jgi:hypothetical protein
MPLLRSSTLLLLALLCCTGCRGKTAPRAEVRGTVYYHGAPVRGGIIVFTPDAARGGNGPLAHAEIQPDGSYVLESDGQPGAVAGWHRITLSAVEGYVPSPPGSKFAIPAPMLPEKYRDPDLSGLSREVKMDQANVIDLSLD